MPYHLRGLVRGAVFSSALALGVFLIPSAASAQKALAPAGHPTTGAFPIAAEPGIAPAYVRLAADASARLERFTNHAHAGSRGAIVGALIASPIAFYLGRKIYQDRFVDGCIGCGYEGIAAGVGIVASGAVIGYLVGRMFNSDSAEEQ